MEYTKRDRSDAQEKRCEVYYNALRNPNSGATQNYKKKGDLRDSTHVIECKCSMADAISIRKEDVRKVEKQASLNGKKYILNYEFQGERPDDVLYNMTLLPTDDFIEMYEIYKKHRKEIQNNLMGNITLSAKDFVVDVINKLDRNTKAVVRLQMKLSSKYNDLVKHLK